MINVDQLERLLKITGLAIIASGLVLGLFNMQGWLEDEETIAVLNWTLTSGTGMKISHPGAKKFFLAFPPPSNVNVSNITHLTKLTTKVENGLVMDAQINYMLKDESRTEYVASLYDVRKWATATNYTLWAWILSLIGFIEVMASFIIQALYKNEPNASKA